MNTIQLMIKGSKELKEATILDKAVLEMRNICTSSNINKLTGMIEDLKEEVYTNIVEESKNFKCFLIEVEEIYVDEYNQMEEEEKELYWKGFEEYVDYTVDDIFSKMIADN